MLISSHLLGAVYPLTLPELVGMPSLGLTNRPATGMLPDVFEWPRGTLVDSGVAFGYTALLRCPLTFPVESPCVCGLDPQLT